MNTALFILTYGLCAIVTATEYPIICSKTGNLSETIDGNKHQCCKGNKEVRQDEKKCCYESGEFYFPSRTLCCGGKLTEKSSDKSIVCCDKEVIDDSKYLCCMNQKTELPKGLNRNNAACCANKVYNISHQFCCGNKLYTKNPKVGCCGLTAFDKDTHWCDPYNRLNYKNIIDCGGKKISLLNQSCCKGVPNDVPHFYEHYVINEHRVCCEDKPINNTIEKCCSAGHSISRHLSCCGKGSFDPPDELCCGGQAVKKVGQADTCCGLKPYNYQTQGCCGKTVFNRDTEKCCRGYNGQTVHNKTTQCCGQNELVTGSVCCRDNFAVEKDSPEDDKCCASGQGKGISYNSKKKGCLSGGIYTKGEEEPCGSVLIKIKSEMCCIGVRHMRGPDSECCGVKVFDKKKQICCSSHVYNISPNEGSCCDNRGYKNAELPDDCGEIPNPLRERRTGLTRECGNKYYEIDEHYCCDDKLYSRQEDEERSSKELCLLLTNSSASNDCFATTFSTVGIIVSVFAHFLF